MGTLTKDDLLRQIELTEGRDDTLVMNAVRELLEYKKTEERFGVDLFTLLQAMEEGVYVRDEDDNIVFIEPAICFNQEVTTGLYTLDIFGVYPPNRLARHNNYYLKDCGITWALTKEKLE